MSIDGGKNWKVHPRTLDIFGENPTHDPREVRASLFLYKDIIFLTTLKKGCFSLIEMDWVKSDCLAASENSFKTTLFMDSIVMIPFRGNRNRLLFFDGTGPWSVEFNGPVLDAVASTPELFVLVRENSRGMIYYASTLRCRCKTDFLKLGYLDIDPMEIRSVPSLEFADNRLFLGTFKGNLYVTQELKLYQ